MIITRRSLIGAVSGLLAAGGARANLFQEPFTVSGGGGGGKALVAHAIYIPPSGAVGSTAPINTTGANFIAVTVTGVAGYGTTPPEDSVTDNKGNTYLSAVFLNAVSIGEYSAIFYRYAPVVGTNHIFTSGSPYQVIAVAAFSGVSASPLDQTDTEESAGPVTSVTVGPITPTTNDQLIIVCGSMYIADGPSIIETAGYLTTDGVGYEAASHFAHVMGYQLQGTAAATSCTMSAGPSGAQMAATMASFK